MAQTQDLQRLVVSLEAKMTQYDRAMAKAAGTTDRTMRRIDAQFARVEGRMKSFGRGLLGGIAGGLSGNAVRSMIADVAKIADEAKATGVSVQKLQRLLFAVKQEGGTPEALVTGLKKLNVTIGEGITKGNDFSKILAANGIAIESLANDPARALEVVADLMRGAGSAAERATIAQAAMGRGAAELIPFLRQGSEAIRQSGDYAQELSLILGDQLVANAKRFDDAINAVGATIATKLKGGAVSFLREIEKIVLAVDRMGAALPSVFPGLNAEQVKELEAAFPALKAQRGSRLGTVSRNPFDTQRGPDTKTVVPVDLTDAQKKANKETERQAEAIAKVIENLNFERQQLSRTDRERAIYNELARAGVELDSKHGKVIAELAGKFYDEQQALEDFTGSMDEARDMTNGFFGDLISGLREGKSLTDALAAAFQNLADKMLDRTLDMAVDALLGKAGSTSTGVLGQVLGIKAPLSVSGTATGGLAPFVSAGAAARGVVPPWMSSKTLGLVPSLAGGLGGFRNIKRNNPGNIEFGQFAEGFGGVLGKGGRFAQFPNLSSGFDAMRELLFKYGQGQNTVSSVINKWSPQVDPTNAAGSTSNYAKYVAGQMGVGVNDPLNLAQNPDLTNKMMAAMAKFEHNLTKVADTAATAATGFEGAFPPALASVVQAIGGAGSGASGGFLNMLLSGFGSGGGPRAMGGPVSPGKAYTVGERGPELFMPRVPGLIVPNSGGRTGAEPRFALDVTPSPYFDVRVRRIASIGDARTLNTARRNLPGTAARYNKLGTT